MEHNNEENKKQIVFWIGILNLLLSLVCIPTRFNISVLCIIISIVCFNCSKEYFKRIFINPTIKSIIKIRKRKKVLENEIILLDKQKQEIEIYLKNKQQYLLNIKNYSDKLNELSLKEKSINRNIIILKYKEQDLKNKIDKERCISKKVIQEENKLKFLRREIDRLNTKKEILNAEIKQNEENNKFRNDATLEYIDSLDGIEFEEFIMKLLKYLNFEESYTTKETGDYGIDVIAIKNNIKYAIQCKNYLNHVGNKAIQEAYSGKDYYDCHVAIVVTNNYFTNNAIKQASKNKVVLWDRDVLSKMIQLIK